MSSENHFVHICLKICPRQDGVDGGYNDSVTFQGALIQSISAIGGVFSCAAYLRDGSIWSAVLLHSMFNASTIVEWLFTNSGGDMKSSLNSLEAYQLIFLAFDLLIVAFLLRKSKCQRILDRIQQLNAVLG